MESTSEFAESIASEIERETGGAPAEPVSEPSSAPEPEAAAPEPAPAAPEAPEPPQQRQSQMIPAHVLAAERQRYQRELAARDARIAAIEASMAPKPPPMPDPEQEPIAFLKWQADERAKQQAEGETKAQAEQRAQQEQEYTQQVISTYAEAVEEATEVVPDWYDAYESLQKLIHQDLRAQGYRNPIQRAEMMKGLEFQTVRDCLSRNVNPAQVIYNEAIRRGYRPAGQAEPTPAPKPEIPAFQAPASAAPPRDPSTGQFKPAKAPPKSLSHAPGAPGGQLNAEALLAMDPKEFDRITADGGWKKLHAR